MISVGMSRTEGGAPVMLEKAYPTSEQLHYEDGPSANEEARRMGWFVDGCGLDEPQRRYSHSSADLS
jgi:hypothetical protein